MTSELSFCCYVSAVSFGACYTGWWMGHMCQGTQESAMRDPGIGAGQGEGTYLDQGTNHTQRC